MSRDQHHESMWALFGWIFHQGTAARMITTSETLTRMSRPGIHPFKVVPQGNRAAQRKTTIGPFNLCCRPSL